MLVRWKTLDHMQGYPVSVGEMENKGGLSHFPPKFKNIFVVVITSPPPPPFSVQIIIIPACCLLCVL